MKKFTIVPPEPNSRASVYFRSTRPSEQSAFAFWGLAGFSINATFFRLVCLNPLKSLISLMSYILTQFVGLCCEMITCIGVGIHSGVENVTSDRRISWGSW